MNIRKILHETIILLVTSLIFLGVLGGFIYLFLVIAGLIK